MNPECHWYQEDEDSDVWQTQCGHYMTIIEGTPAENEFAHCCFCGKSLVGHVHEPNTFWTEEQIAKISVLAADIKLMPPKESSDGK